ncbi:MAG: RagB/SusD family nutrient uptake outer membrane protein [Sphingobacterium sp.]|jgi:tetratricopeptide (TPR) repeat protein|uniref:RagB/SusD family nutrient uptake outer membrane protein n=1 Tax=Sphingobacterium sp. TaxID=341027 RepID=UPI0028445F85|nr:RagB/SusD family nutrient uptake outer membrane protein [Sphingobacterium sp.]MDR3006769.1 RagB/SusD family nutrient uptake outer membrane protein [Sphingobacterium sp.]
MKKILDIEIKNVFTYCKKYTWRVSALAIILSTLGSCKKDLLDITSNTQVPEDKMWTTDNYTDLGVNGVYQALRFGYATGGTNNRELYQYDRLSNTLIPRGGDVLLNATANTSTSLFADVWKELYESVHRANDAIYGISNISPSAPEKKARLLAEVKFLRAFYYYRLNQLYRGVPIYDAPIKYNEATKPRNTEKEVWDFIIKDLTDCIAEANLPTKFPAGDKNFGRISKSAAYALRGKVYMYLQDWDKAIADFQAVKDAGHQLFPNYKALFTAANEKSDEMIFSIQNIALDNYGSTMQFYFGSRSAFGSNWDTYMVSPDFVDLYENKDGSKFNWDDVIPGYSAMAPEKREIYFVRNNVEKVANDNKKPAKYNDLVSKGLNFGLYLNNGNEERLRKAYDNRDPRLSANVILPYSTFVGMNGSADQTFTSRWPHIEQLGNVFDLRTDMESQFFYIPRKFVYEGGKPPIPSRVAGDIDYPVIRYADVLLLWAEALNEKGQTAPAVDKVNEVRSRAGVGLLNSSVATTVKDKADLTSRIRNERRRELFGEGVIYFDELRWKSWKDQVFSGNAGNKQPWGAIVDKYTYLGDQLLTWPIPEVERQRNTSLTQNTGW